MKKIILAAFCLGLVNAQAQNLGFENWSTTSTSQDSAHGWSSTNKAVNNITSMINSLFKESTSVNSGNHAAHLQTAPFGFTGAPIVGIMVNGEAKLSFNASTTQYVSGGGEPYTKRPVAFTGHYKLAGSYVGIAQVLLSKYNALTQQRDTIAFNDFTLSINTSFAQFSIPLTYLSAASPDSATVVFYASDPAVVPSMNASFSSLYIDDLAFTGTTAPVTNGGVVAVTSPAAASVVNTADTVIAWLKNYGSTPIANFDVAYIVNGQIRNKVLQNHPDTIAPNDSVLFKFQQLWTPPSSGNYNICVMVENIANDLDQKNDTSCNSVSSTLSLTKLQLHPIGLYPNPVKSTLQLKHLPPHAQRIAIFTLGGNEIMQQTAERNTMDLSSLQTGLYVLTVLDKQGNTLAREKLIKH